MLNNFFYHEELEAGKATANSFARYQQFLKETSLPHSYKSAKIWDEQCGELMS